MKKRSTSKERNAWTTIVASVLILAIALPQLIAWLPANEILGPSARAFTYNVRNATIQGWGFFTKSPREPAFHMYKEKRDEGQSTLWAPPLRSPNNQFRNWFGLDRTSRLQEFDISALTSDLEASEWIHCGDVSDVPNCANIAKVKSIDRPSGSFELCGRYLVTRAEPVPWSYRNLRKGMPGEAVIIDVTC